jgi:hypothetical protein
MAIPTRFAFNRDVLAGAGDVALQLDAGGTELASALALNSPLPKPNDPVLLGSVAFGVEADKQLALGSDSQTVTFGASATAKFGLFSLPAQLRTAIVDGGDLAESVETALDFDTGSAAPFLLLRLGYNLDATATGAVALGTAGTLKFGANVARDGLYAVVHQPRADRQQRAIAAPGANGRRPPARDVDHRRSRWRPRFPWRGEVRPRFQLDSRNLIGHVAGRRRPQNRRRCVRIARLQHRREIRGCRQPSVAR